MPRPEDAAVAGGSRRTWQGGAMVRERFEGRILGVGTTSGHRIVVGDWARSPLGTFADVMHALPDGRRRLLAPNEQVAEYVGATYHFDEVVLCPVEVGGDPDGLDVTAGDLRLQVRLGGRTAIGRLLRAIPTPVSTSVAFARLCDPFARVLMPGVRTTGTAGGGRREYYSAQDVRSVTWLQASLDGTDLGGLAPVDPPPDFGFSSTPRTPGLTRVTTTILR